MQTLLVSLQNYGENLVKLRNSIALTGQLQEGTKCARFNCSRKQFKKNGIHSIPATVKKIN